MRKKFTIYSILIGLAVFLAGCQPGKMPPVTAESTGFWSKMIVYPISQAITFFADLFGNYGWGIIIVTIIIRLILLPLNIKQLKSSQAMQEIQPKMKELQEKYSSKDQQTQQKLQQEMMALFKENNVNPLAGCLPIIVQMPFLIGMYQAIVRTPAIEKGTFLWFQLGQSDILLPIITGAAMFIQQKLMMASNTAAAENPQMKIMLYMMPLMITVFAFILPSALALYWIVGSLFMIAQTLVIRRPLEKQHESGGGKN